MKRVLVRVNDRLERATGYRVSRIHRSSDDATNGRRLPTDALAAWYRSRGRPFLVRVPAERCRTFGANAFRCSVDEPDPLTATLLAIQRGTCAGYEGSPLEDFYTRWQPRTQAEAEGIDADRLPVDSPLRGPVRTYPTRLERDGFVQHRDPATDGPVSGCLYHGPVSPSFGRVTLRRALHVRDSIQRRGWDPTLSSLSGRLHVDADGGWQIELVSGKHTAAALLALGHTELTVELGVKWPPISHRSDVHGWRRVQRGWVSTDVALESFDRQFACRQPAGYERS